MSSILEIIHLLLAIGVRFVFRQSVMLKNARKRKGWLIEVGAFVYREISWDTPSQEDKMGKHEIKVKKPHKGVAVE